MNNDFELLRRQLEREILARKQAESILEKKALELFEANRDLKALNTGLENEVKIRTFKLEESEKQYREIVENSSDFIYSADAQGIFTYVNEPALNRFGYQKDYILGMHFTNLVKEDYKKRALDFYLAMREEGASQSYIELPVKTAKGETIWLGQSAKLNINNGIKSYSMIAKDITERKNSEEKYKSIFENMNLGIVEIDTEGKVVKAYPLFCEQLGYKEEELLGQDFISKLINDPDSKLFKGENRSKSLVKTQELQLKKKDDSLIWMLVSEAPFFDRDQFMGSLAIHFDLTSQKTLQHELEKAKIKAESAEKAERIFLANMSHEIRTPLNAIVGMSHLLESSSLNAEQADHLDVLQSSADILLNLISDILDIAKIDAGSMEIRNKKFDLVKLMNSIEKTFTVKLDSSPVSVQLELDTGLDRLLVGDPVLLNQILYNLVGNAEKFTNEGYIYIRARIIDRDNDRISIRFEVEDTGIGMEEDKLKFIFDQFRQIDGREEVSQKGTGLGLAITKKIIDLLDGDIHVSSRLGTGSKFSIVLHFEETNIALRDAKQEIKKDYESIVLKNPILIVEDNKMNQKYISKLFEKWNYDYRMAENGLEAVELARRYPFSIIFMDLQMPKMNGYEATKAIRQLGNANSDIPIVALTASTLSSKRNEALDAGMSDFLAKPFNPDQILDVLDKYVNELVENTEQSEESATSDIHINETGFVEEKMIKQDLFMALEKDQEKEVVPEPTSGKIEIDEKYLEATYGNDKVYASEIFSIFLEKTPEELNNLKNSERLSQVVSIAHKIKPTFQMVGLAKFTNDLGMIEELASNSQHEELNQKIDIFLNEAQIALSLVEERFAKMQT